MELRIDENITAKAVYIHGRRHKKLRMVTWGLLTFAWLCCFIIYAFAGMSLLLALVLLLTLLVAVMVSPLQIPILRMILARQYKQMADAGDDISKVSVTYDAQGITYTTAKSSVRTEWSAYVAYKEQSDLLLLYRHKRHFQVLPLNQISDADQTAIQGYINHYIPEPE